MGLDVGGSMCNKRKKKKKRMSLHLVTVVEVVVSVKNPNIQDGSKK